MRVSAIRGKQTRERGNVIARIFKGAPKTDNRPGRDLDYFRIEWEDSPSVNKEWAQQCFDEVFGPKPDTLRNVQFLTDDPESALESVNEKWATGNKGVPFCTQRCTGESIFYQFSGQAASREIRPCEYPACGCAFTYRLRFWLPDFTYKSGILGEFLLTAHSREDYERIQPQIDNMANVGLLRRVAFTLYRKPVRVVQPSGVPVMKSIVHLDIMEAGAQQMALAAGEGAMAPALPAGSTNVRQLPDDIIEVQDNESSITFIVAVERRLSGQQTRYILDTDTGHKITIYTRQKFREAGYDVESWQDIKGRLEITPIPVSESYNGQYWQLDTVHPPQPPSLADSIPL